MTTTVPYSAGSGRLQAGGLAYISGHIIRFDGCGRVMITPPAEECEVTQEKSTVETVLGTFDLGLREHTRNP